MIAGQYTRPNVSLNLSLNLWNNQTENNPVTSLCNIWQLWTQHFSQDLSLIEKKRDRDNKHYVRFRCTFEAFYLHLFFKCFVCSHYEQICSFMQSSLPLMFNSWNFQRLWFGLSFHNQVGFVLWIFAIEGYKKKCVCVCIYSILMI